MSDVNIFITIFTMMFFVSLWLISLVAFFIWEIKTLIAFAISFAVMLVSMLAISFTGTVLIMVFTHLPPQPQPKSFYDDRPILQQAKAIPI